MVIGTRGNLGCGRSRFNVLFMALPYCMRARHRSDPDLNALVVTLGVVRVLTAAREGVDRTQLTSDSDGSSRVERFMPLQHLHKHLNPFGTGLSLPGSLYPEQH
jgi:hypothetical protein